MIMVETQEGIVIIDTTENRKVAQAIMGEFCKITDKPLKGVIYTHYHGDHIKGTKVFFEPGTPVYAQEDFMKEFKLHASREETAAMRAGAIFGLIMPSERIPMATAFPVPGASHLMWEVLKPEDFFWPTVTFRDKHSFRLCGLTSNLFPAPGTTPDQIMVDVPELQFVCCADNYYASFPNPYTIRGTSYRPAMHWATPQDKVIALEPEFLVPCHGAPIQGKGVIKEVLGNYRDAILHVHNTVLKGIQNGNSVESIIAAAVLPPNLAGLPDLQPYYGCIPYSARAIYDSYVGWFDGNPTNLSPLSRKELGAELLEMVGSADKVLVHAENALGYISGQESSAEEGEF